MKQRYNVSNMEMEEIKVKEQYNWNLKDIFENEEQFKKEKGEIADILEKLKTYQGILCNTSDNLYNCYKLYEQALEKFEKSICMWNAKISLRYVKSRWNKNI